MNALATLPKNEIVTRGLEEDIDNSDLIIPRAKLMQAMSPEVQEGKAKPGKIINSITMEELPEEFIPVFKFTNWMRFNPRKKDDVNFNPDYAPGDILWRSNDPHDPRVIQEGQWGPNNEAPVATKFLNFFSYFPGVPMPVVISFSKTSFKAGKQLLTLCKFLGGDIFSKKYYLGTVKITNDMGSFFIYSIAPRGNAKKEDIKVAETWYQQFNMSNIKVHEEDVKTSDVDSEENFPFN
jgi:hypothetical protein